VIVYGVAEAGIAEVWNVAEKLPFDPIVAVVVMLSMVMETSSPDGGKFAPELMVPESEIEGVPCVMASDDVRFEKTGVNCVALTVMDADGVSVALLSAVMVAVFWSVPALEVELLTCTLAPIAGARLPIAQPRTCAPTAPEIEHVPGPAYVGVIVQFAPAPAGRGSLSATLFAVPVPPTVLFATEIGKPTGSPEFAGAESAGFVALRLGAAMASGKATTTSLNWRVVPPIPESTGSEASNDVVMSNSNWQEIAGFEVGCGLVIPTSMGVLQFEPYGVVSETGESGSSKSRGVV